MNGSISQISIGFELELRIKWHMYFVVCRHGETGMKGQL